jgi:hypothetical protein
MLDGENVSTTKEPCGKPSISSKFGAGGRSPLLWARRQTHRSQRIPGDGPRDVPLAGLLGRSAHLA